jgi:PAS domain S-box-containing protein
MSSPEENKAVVRRYIEEVDAGNLDVVDELFAEGFTTGTDVQRSDIEVAGTESMKDVWREFYDAFPDMALQSHELVADGDAVMTIQVWEGTHEGPFRGVEATGNEVTHEMWSRFVLEDGEIVHVDAQGDNFGLFTQLGMALSIEGYRTLIDTAPDPIVITDVETARVVETNAAAEALLERPREDIIGNPQRELHPPDERYDDLFGTAIDLATGHSVELSTLPDGSDVELYRADGSRVPVEITARVVTLADVTTLVSIYRDISRRRRRKQRLEVLNRVLRHNLRNDLGVVEGLAESLIEDMDGESAARAERIRAKVDDLVALATKAREVERVVAVETTTASAVDVRELADDVRTEVTAAHPDAEVSLSVPPDMTVVTSRGALSLALENLLENAVEHSEEETVEANVRAETADDGVRIVVADDGPGLPDHELAVLDEGVETPLEHGSGIGLWLVHWVADAIRAELSFEVDDDGTRAVLTVPDVEETGLRARSGSD